MPVSDTCDMMLEKLRTVGKDGLATLKKMTRTSSVMSGAMLRNWPLTQADLLGAATVSVEVMRGAIPSGCSQETVLVHRLACKFTGNRALFHHHDAVS